MAKKQTYFVEYPQYLIILFLKTLKNNVMKYLAHKDTRSKHLHTKICHNIANKGCLLKHNWGTVFNFENIQ